MPTPILVLIVSNQLRSHHEENKATRRREPKERKSAMTTYGYTRISTSKQTLEHHVAALEKLGVPREHIFTDVRSGKNTDRKELQALMALLKKGDTLHIEKVDRLGRSIRDLHDIADQLEAKGVTLVIGGSYYDPTTPEGAMFFGMLALFADMERRFIVQRTKERLDHRRENGLPVGRTKSTSDEMDALLVKTYAAGQHSYQDLATLSGLSKATVRRIIQRAQDGKVVATDPKVMLLDKKQRAEKERAERAIRARAEVDRAVTA